MSNLPQTVGFKAGERNVFLHLLTACNLSCSHCYINREQHGSQMISRDQIERWIKLFAVNGRKSNIIFLGGEPTMHPDLVHAIQIARQHNFNTTVDTNGYLFHDFLKRVSPEMLDFLSFSLDGPNSAINDPIRGEGVFDVCSENIKRAVSRGFNVSLIYTVSSRNIAHLGSMADLVVDLGIKKFFIQVIGLRGNSAQENKRDSGPILQVAPAQWLSVVPDVARQVAAKGIEVVYPKVYLDKGEPFECAGNVAENFFVFPNGRVYQCPLCEDHPIHSFEIRDNELVKRNTLTEARFFSLEISEGCVMNKLLQPDTISYHQDGTPVHRISCCLLKQRITG